MILKILKRIFFCFLILLALTTNIKYIGIEKASAAENENSDLINKISKDFTKKFCNSTGFGLSKESAMNFSIAENKKVFEKRQGIKYVDKNVLANKIAVSVIDGCGYQLNLYNDEDIEEFANYYLSFQKETLFSNK